MRHRAVVLVAAMIACQSRSPSVSVSPAAGAAAAPIVDGFLVKDGVLVLRGRDTAQASIVLERSGRSLRVRQIARTTDFVTTDTIDAAGLYVHTANSVDATAPKPGQVALLVLRAGPSPGDPVVGVLGGSPGWRRLSPAENRPGASPDPRAGCYAVDVGDWSDAAAAAEVWRATVPSDIQLHWQYLWHFGRAHDLVATDGRGKVPGPFTDIHLWIPVSSDSIRIVFSTGHEAASFRLRSEGNDLAGEVTRATDSASGPNATAPVRLRRIECSRAPA